MAITQYFTKSDDEVLDYAVDWSDWLNSDTISSSSWSSSAVTIDSDTNSTTTATVWLSGGTSGDIDQVTNQIVTAGGRTAERSFNLTIEDR